MATKAEYGEALKAAHAAGDTAGAAKLAEAYANASDDAPSVFGDVETQIGTIAAEGYRQGKDAVASALPRAWEAAKGGALKMRQEMFPPGGPIEALTMQPSAGDTERKAEIEKFEARKPELGTAGVFGEHALEGALTALPLARTGKILSKAMPLLGRAAPLAGDVLANAGYEGGKVLAGGGGIVDAAKAAGWGGLGGGVGHGIGHVAQKGMPMSASARTLADAGVTPTYGQMLGRRASQAEELLTYSPTIGGAIQHARDTTREVFSPAVVNDAISGVGAKLKINPFTRLPRKSGEFAVEEGQNLLSGGYQHTLPHVQMDTRGAVNVLANLPSELAQNPSLVAHGGDQIVNQWANNTVNAHMGSGGTIGGEAWKQIDSDIAKEIKRYANSSVASEQHIADGFRRLQKLWFDNLSDVVAGSGAKESVGRLDAAWRKLVPTGKAAESAAGNMGEFSPVQVHRAATSGKNGQSSLDVAGRELISERPPMGYRVLRKAVQLGGLAAGLSADTTMPLAGTIAARLAYTRPVRSVIAKGIPGLRSKSLDKLPFTAANIGAQVGSRWAQPKDDEE